MTDADFADTAGTTNRIYQDARKALSLIGAFSALFEMQGEEQVKKANTLLSSKTQQLPAPVVSKLCDIRGVNRPAVAAAPATAAD